jgi:hypothetical protein
MKKPLTTEAQRHRENKMEFVVAVLCVSAPLW